MGSGYEPSARGDANWMENNIKKAALGNQEEMKPGRDNPIYGGPLQMARGLALGNIASILDVSTSAVQMAETVMRLIGELSSILLSMEGRRHAHVRQVCDMFEEFLQKHNHHDGVMNIIRYSQGKTQDPNFDWCMSTLNNHEGSFDPEHKPVLRKASSFFLALKVSVQKPKKRWGI